MKLETCQIFAQLCEAYLPEASSSLSMVAQKPGGKEVIKRLHVAHRLSHDQEYRSIAKISWNELKDAANGAWVIIRGDRGVGAIKASRGTYRAVASAGGEPEEFTNDRGGNILDFLKGIIGQLREFHVGADSGSVGKLQKQRSDLNKTQGPAVVNKEALVKKFKPLWLKAMQAAQADIKGMAANMIKNDAFSKAKKKLQQLEELDNGISALETGTLESAPEFVEKAVQMGIYMAASYYYPEQTGEITKGYRGYDVSDSTGTRKLLADISAGDTKKLGTILAFFKRSLIA
jgi:hypothetical protein